jgi:hypothetical protein
VDLIVDRHQPQRSIGRRQEPPLADLRRTPLGSIDRRRAAEVAYSGARDEGDLGRIDAATFGSTI